MNNSYKKAFRELDYILENTNKDIKNKIPARFIKYMKKNMDKNYIPNIDCTKKLDTQNILEETRELMAIVYRDYLVNDDKRDILLKKERELQKDIEKEKEEKYKLEFKQKEPQKAIIKIDNTKEKWYTKIWKRIRKLGETLAKNKKR